MVAAQKMGAGMKFLANVCRRRGNPTLSSQCSVFSVQFSVLNTEDCILNTQQVRVCLRRLLQSTAGLLLFSFAHPLFAQAQAPSLEDKQATFFMGRIKYSQN